ncbi:pre-mRNA-splicing factor atp-dependent RNA helicase deah3-related [Anaeramoeba flamelloides]|uniref:RNA helicase n=1 Tax=Anaeramoeba flamelloides TaxID=1746091 RepID=A0AAV7YGI5_9EUKA|nr:pre-mRNA-splicing factor atp-dependent RNA helicase deah3-related [Anaeramoeba flamelloides]
MESNKPKKKKKRTNSKTKKQTKPTPKTETKQEKPEWGNTKTEQQEKLEPINFQNKDKIHPLTKQKFSKNYFEILETREQLPITAQKENFVKLLEENQVIILTGETGSGKTTQIPQYILEAGYSYGGKYRICCTQPRRVAALSVATRVSEEMDVELGSEVGYTIRFEDKSSPETLVKYLTDGMLLREAMIDNNLSQYSVIIIDEAHERTISTDILFGLLKQLLTTTRKDDLKVIVMSATIEHKLFQEYFNNAPHLDVTGRVYPVDIFYLEEGENDYVSGVIKTSVEIHLSEPKGDVLIFLTGQEEIEDCCERLYWRLCDSKSSEIGEFEIIPLYAALPYYEQKKAFMPTPDDKITTLQNGEKKTLYGRKFIIATNIAETSLTIQGIVYVIDPGFSKQKVFDPKKRVESLLVSPISRASANQRKGRAGRTQSGKCFRLYTKKTFEQLERQTIPELLRSNLGPVLLNMKKMGIINLLMFDYLSPPSIDLLVRALETNHYLGGLDEDGELTELGHQISSFPLDPQLAKMLIKSQQYDCCDEILTIVAMLSTPNCFIRPRKRRKQADQARARFIDCNSDHLTLLNVYNEYFTIQKNQKNKWCKQNFINNRTMYQAVNIRKQLFNILRRLDLYRKSYNDYSKNQSLIELKIKKCLVEGFFMQTAYKLKRKKYLIVRDKQQVLVYPGSSIQFFRDWILFHEFVLTERNYIRTCTSIEGRWLVDIAPHYYETSKFSNGRVKSALESLHRQRKSAMEKFKKKKMKKGENATGKEKEKETEMGKGKGKEKKKKRKKEKKKENVKENVKENGKEKEKEKENTKEVKINKKKKKKKNKKENKNKEKKKSGKKNKKKKKRKKTSGEIKNLLSNENKIINNDEDNSRKRKKKTKKKKKE